jgi:hypothetical protein
MYWSCRTLLPMLKSTCDIEMKLANNGQLCAINVLCNSIGATIEITLRVTDVADIRSSTTSSVFIIALPSSPILIVKNDDKEFEVNQRLKINGQIKTFETGVLVWSADSLNLSSALLTPISAAVDDRFLGTFFEFN